MTEPANAHTRFLRAGDAYGKAVADLVRSAEGATKADEHIVLVRRISETEAELREAAIAKHVAGTHGTCARCCRPRSEHVGRDPQCAGFAVASP
jgi:hypothetical protein